MSLPRFVVFGDALTDFIRQPDDRWQACPGGAGLNLARIAAGLGLSAAFAGAISDDYFGLQLAHEATTAGLDTRFLQRLPHTPLLAMVPATEPPQYFFVGDNSADLHFDPAALPDGWMEAARIACFGGISLARPPLADRLLAIAGQLAARGTLIAFDPNFRLPMRAADYPARFAAMAALSDFVKVSEEDLAGLFPDADEARALDRLQALAPKAQILLTRGASGLSLISQGQVSHANALPVSVRDTLGCGDAAFGGWLASRLMQPEASATDQMQLARACAACCAEQHGFHAPTLAQVAARLND
ncbi:carbohydrate kinase [Paludibacterium sp. B53371]|uniref:carbohydrate kinase family protein n=1 Tax=Paludibacterium sp. B53371 TaxID=2806263 RepID=UPI001C03C3E0|nr:carbohydrate kinase [Paludibacterium sp. B53371]